MRAPELDLDLDTFEGPFDLLLTLVLREELAPRRGRRGRHRPRVRRPAGGTGAARPRGVRRVPRPRRVAARAEGARPVPGRGGRSLRARPRGGGRGARPAPRGVPAHQGRGDVARRAARARVRPLLPPRPAAAPGAARAAPRARRPGAARRRLARARTGAARSSRSRTWASASRRSSASSTASGRCCAAAGRSCSTRRSRTCPGWSRRPRFSPSSSCARAERFGSSRRHRSHR